MNVNSSYVGNMTKQKKIYALYDKDDRPLIVGTVDEVAAYINSTRNYIYQLVHYTNSGHMKGTKYKAYSYKEV